MPELPEAEIARRQLERWLGDGPLTAVVVEDPAVVRTHLSTRPSDGVPDGRKVLEGLVGLPPAGTFRHGKRVGWGRGPFGVAVHLGMSGRLVRSTEPPRSARVGFVGPTETVWFVDRRRFGCLVVRPLEQLDALLREGHGPDALLEAPDAEALRSRLKGRRAIKVALLDQAVLAGVGNIQAVEALFKAGIDPRTRCDHLTEAQVARLAVVLPAQLQEVIDAEDAGEITYVTDGGDNPFLVYGRASEPCSTCGTPIETLRQSGRSTFFCPTCQA